MRDGISCKLREGARDVVGYRILCMKKFAPCEKKAQILLTEINPLSKSDQYLVITRGLKNIAQSAQKDFSFC